VSEFVFTEVSRRIKRGVGERYARSVNREIEAGSAKNAAVQRFGETIVIRNPDSSRQNQVFGFFHTDLNLLPEILACYEGQTHQPSFYLSSLGFSSKVVRWHPLVSIKMPCPKHSCTGNLKRNPRNPPRASRLNESRPATSRRI
jgi:hypothetical protein